MCVFEPKTRPLGERFAEFNFDSKILLTCGVGYDRERSAELPASPIPFALYRTDVNLDFTRLTFFVFLHLKNFKT
nr:hypothetical protein [Leptospira interrogans]